MWLITNWARKALKTLKNGDNSCFERETLKVLLKLFHS
jgi:hypothetical protein